MTEKIRITTPFTEEQARKLKAGDSVLITGTIISARDAAHKTMTEALERGEKLPIDWQNQIVYYLGPTPAKPGNPIGSAGPTTSGRMDAYTPKMLEQGIKGMVGKGSRSAAVIEAMKKHGVVYMAAVGGAAALISKCIKKYEVLAYPELGPEAVAALEVEDFPAIVVVDSEGNSYYEEGQNIDFMRISMKEGKQQIIEAYESSLRAFLTAIEFREQSTAVHSFEVNHIAIEIAKKMGLSEDEIRDLNWGTLLHDLGKLAIPDSILLKPGPLDDQELDLIRQHPRMGYEILKGASYFKNAIEISLYHHERYDGKGYPNALKGEAIPLLARICAVADTFQAMIDDRPYRKGLPVEAAVAEIKRCSGTQFDPVVVSAFLQIDHSCYPARLKNRLNLS
ncbi:Fe-S-containing hydro-lyase [bacterium BFN5]|nr:Fe-S-containing hydro-lyase [bacterium BFN5]